MKNEAIVKRYADAYIAFAKETIGIDKALEELQKAKWVIRDNEDFKTFLRTLDITNSEKEDVIDKVFKGFSEELVHFLKYLLEKKRITRFLDIAEYARITYSHGMRVEALLKTSYPLDLEVIEEIKTRLEGKLGKKLHLYLELDADLLGGIQIRVGNCLIDGTVRRRLEELREKLMTVQV